MIENLGEAVRYFREKCLENKSMYIASFPGKKGTIAERISDQRLPDNPVIYAVFFKRETFHTFGYIFPQTHYRGEGQTVNLNALKTAAAFGDIIAVVMPDESVWICPASVWLSYVREYNTIRTPSTEIGEEASIPANMLTPFSEQAMISRMGDDEDNNMEPSSNNGNRVKSLDGWM
jgi:hypothetical protein